MSNYGKLSRVLSY